MLKNDMFFFAEHRRKTALLVRASPLFYPSVERYCNVSTLPAMRQWDL